MTAKLSRQTQEAVDEAATLVEAFFADHPELNPETTSLEITNGKVTGYETGTPRGYYAISTTGRVDLSAEFMPGTYNPLQLQPGAKMTNAQSAWFELGRQIDTSIATYQQLAADCLKSWDYPGAARWRATSEGLETARNYMIQIARQTHDLLAATEAEKAAVGSATEAPPAGTIPIP